MVSWTIVSRAPTDRRFVDLVTATCEGGHVTRQVRAGTGTTPDFGTCHACAAAARRVANPSRFAQQRATAKARALVAAEAMRMDREAARAAKASRVAEARAAREADGLARRAAKAEHKRVDRETKRLAAERRLAEQAKARAEARERQIQAAKLARQLAKLPAEKLKAIVEAA